MAYTDRLRDNGVASQRFYNGLLLSSSFESLPGSRSGSSVVNHKSKIRAGQNAGSAYSNDGFEVSYSKDGNASLSYMSLGDPDTIYTDVASGQFVPPYYFNHLSIPTEGVEAKALTGILKRIRSQKEYFAGATFLGELRQTIHGIRRPAEALLKEVNKHFLSLENRKRKVLRLPPNQRRAEWGKAVSGSWLEVQFGWKPLISDSKEIATAIGKLIAEEPKRDRLSYQAKEQTAQVDDPQETVLGSYLTSVITGGLSTQRSVRYIVGMQTQVTTANSAVGRLIDTLGFNPENFIPALWEVTPWSFLVDYFTNIGDIIEAGTTDTKNVTWIVRTERVVSELLRNRSQTDSSWMTQSNPNLVQVANSYGNLGSSHTIRRTVNRTIPESLGVPSLQFTHPGESFGKMANILALLAQRRKGLHDLGDMPSSPKRQVKHFNEAYAHL